MTHIIGITPVSYIEPDDDRAHRCEHIYPNKKQCRSTDAVDCYLPGNYDGEPDAHYCMKHIHSAGFCWGCGTFWAGCEDFDFNPLGLCSNCRYDPDLTGDYEDDEDDPLYMGWMDPYPAPGTTAIPAPTTSTNRMADTSGREAKRYPMRFPTVPPPTQAATTTWTPARGRRCRRRRGHRDHQHS